MLFTRHRTAPVTQWQEAAQTETAFEQRQAEADARAEFEHNEAIKDVCAEASNTLRPLTLARAFSDYLKPVFDREFAAYKGTLELMTGEDWPAMLPDFLRECDKRATGDGIGERDLQAWVA